MFGCVGYIFLSIVELAIVGMLEKSAASRNRGSAEIDCVDSSSLIIHESQPSKRFFRESRRRKVLPVAYLCLFF